MSFIDFDRYIFQRMGELFRNDFEEGQPMISDGSKSTKSPWQSRGMLTVKTDLLEKSDSYIINMELPGVQKQDIQVHVENGTLNVLAERKEEDKRDNDRYHYSERRYGSIRRVITLPELADPEMVKAEYENGVLQISFAKRPESSSRKQITIS